ncbi:competence type IV pilus ATPase ComGA [Ligilactobacillus ceti]|uniref:Comg operon protein 1 n=1 Tax=Ligilactobacillus ceti DSM 22408 TaxID=1122146 RepID=A0A0R2KKP9_9LACO|nr:competence type IV pilus ATPase ComGA [Ligilactobacillus ceti]KRN89969.1 comg operon protein 1 [Ligilactobacillus ceti DSM 22408]
MQSKVEKLIQDAISQKAMDIYFLPTMEGYIVSYSVQGQRIIQKEISGLLGQQIINYLKFKGNMSLSEKRRPQLGADYYQAPQGRVYLRYSTVGNFLDQESMVIRLLYPQQTEQLAVFYDDQWQRLEKACLRRGLILFSGPMGSGKTTTMYYFAKKFQEQAILCIEDPVEIQEPAFLQLQVNEKAGMTYPNLLKVALRHHPDIFIIGEIRDEQTAKVAITAALSGHLVLSTVHAKSAQGVLQRLLNLGLTRDEIEQAVQLVSYQRLIPTQTAELKILFEQITAHDFQGSTEISADWGERIEQCYQSGWISQKDKEKYYNG